MAVAKSRKFVDSLLSLGEREFSTYTVLLGRSPLTVSEAGLYSGRTLQSTKESLDELQKQGFAASSLQTIPTYSVKLPFDSLADQFTRTAKMLAKTEATIKVSLEESLNMVGSGVKNLMDTIESQDAEINEILENKIKDNEEAFKRTLIENRTVFDEQTASLRTDLDDAIEATRTELGADLDKIKGMINDALAGFEKNLVDSTSEDDLNKNIDQLFAYVETFKKLPVELTETIQQFKKEMSEYVVGFKSASSQALGEFGETTKMIQAIQETSHTSLESAAGNLNYALSSIEESLTEVMGTKSSSRQKSSIQTVFMDMHASIIKSTAKVLDVVPQLHTDLIEKLGSRLDLLSSKIKKEIRAYSEAMLGLTGSDSFMEKLLDSETRTLESETKKVGRAVSQWTQLALARTEDLLEWIRTNSTTPLQSLEENAGGFAEESLQYFNQSKPLAGIQAFADRLQQYNEQFSKTYGSFETNLDSFRGDALAVLQEIAQQYSASVSRAVKTLENIKNVSSGTNADVAALSSDLEALTNANMELDQLKEQASAKMISLQNEILGSVRKLSIEHSKMVLTAPGQLEEELESIRDKVSKLVKNVTNEIRDALTKARKRLEEEKEKRGELETTLNAISAESNEAIEKQLGRIADSLKEFKEEASTTLEAQLQKLEGVIGDELGAFKEHSTEISAAASKMIESQRAAVGDLREKMNENVLGSLARIGESLSASLTSARELSNKALDDTRKGINDTALNLVGRVNDTVSTIGGRIAGLADENSKLIEAHSKQATKDINRLCTKETEKIILKTSSSVSSLKGKLNELRTSVSEQRTEITGRVEEETAILANSLGNQVSSINEKLKSGLSELIPSTVENLSSILTTSTSQQNAAIKGSVTGHAESRNNRLFVVLEEIKEAVKQQASLTRSEVDPILNEITTSAKRNAEILLKLDRTAHEYAPTSTGERTWPLFSKHAINEHIDGMIDRAKTTLFIHAPASSYLPLSKQLEKRKDVLFHIQLGEETKKKRETDGAKARAAVENNLESIRALANVRLTTTRKAPYIVVDRDNEEIMIGLEDGEGRIDATATVSEEENYISLVREVIAPSLLLETEKQET